MISREVDIENARLKFLLTVVSGWRNEERSSELMPNTQSTWEILNKLNVHEMAFTSDSAECRKGRYKDTDVREIEQ